MKRFSYYNINGWICLYLALKNNLKKVKKGVDICSIMDYTKQVVSERAITTEKDMAV